MSERLQGWWLARSPRERWLILVMLALVGLVLLWLALIRPVTDARAAARAEHIEAVDRHAAIAQAVEALRATPPRPAPAGPLDQLVTRSAAAAGFTLGSNVAIGPDMLAVSIDAARPPALFGWLTALERQGLSVETLTVQPGANGLVGARATIRAVR